jgi:hypothetical protein
MSNNIYYTEWTGKRTGYDYRLEVTPADVSGTFAAGVVTGVSITNAGSLYTDANNVSTILLGRSGLTLNIQAAGIGEITSVAINNAGADYNDNTIYAVTGGDGTGAEFRVYADGGGSITSVTIHKHGSGYKVNDLLIVDGGNSLGELEVTGITNGEITHVSIHSAGSGYVVNDVVTVSQVLGAGYNQTATVTITSVSSGADYVAFPAVVTKMGSLDVFEFDELPTGMPKGGVLSYDLDLDAAHGLGLTELIDVVLFPRIDTTIQYDNTRQQLITKNISLGTVHSLFIDTDGNGWQEIFTGVQKIGAESGISSSSHLIKIEAHEISKVVTESMQMQDWVVPNSTNLGNYSNFVDTIIPAAPSYKQRRVQAINGDNWYTKELISFVGGYSTVAALITSKQLRKTASLYFGDVTENVTYYKKALSNEQRGAALGAFDTYLIFGISSNNGVTLNRGYYIDDKAYGSSGVRDWLNDAMFTHLKRPAQLLPATVFGVRLYGATPASLIPKNYISLATGTFLKWDLKIGENTYNSVEVSVKEKRGDDIEKYVATTGVQSENTKQTSVGLAWNTTGIGVKEAPAFEVRYGTVVYVEPTLENPDKLNSGYLTVHQMPNISLSYDTAGVVSGADTDTVLGLAQSINYTGRIVPTPNFKLHAIQEQQTNGIEAVIAKTINKYFGKIRWSVEADLGMEYLVRPDVGSGVRHDWLFAYDGFNFDLSQEPYRDYFQGLPTTVPTDWVLVKSSLDLDTEIVSTRFIEKPQ